MSTIACPRCRQPIPYERSNLDTADRFMRLECPSCKRPALIELASDGGVTAKPAPRKSRFRLTVVSDPTPHLPGAAFAARRQPPVFGSQGSIDVICGKCGATLCKSMYPGQISNGILVCPTCGCGNAIISIPALTNFVEQVQSTPGAIEHLPALRAILEDARAKKASHSEVVTMIEQQAPDLAHHVKDLLIPKTAGDFYALLACLLMFLFWWVPRKSPNESATTIINNFFGPRDPAPKVGPNATCPCGSGKKFKKCHGKPGGAPN